MDNDGVEYNIERQVTFGNGNNPLWLNANKYGLSGINSDNGFVRLGVDGGNSLGSRGNWHLDYGADFAVGYNLSSSFVIQQLYAGVKYKKVGLWVGAKEHPAHLKNAELSSGSQTLGINARPIPDVRIEAPDYIPILRDKRWLSFKFHLGYGYTTDSRWQKHFAADGTRYTDNFFCHTKSFFLKIGDEEQFPLVGEMGMEHATQFGGASYNTFPGVPGKIDMKSGIKDFIEALYSGGNDPTDVYKNAKGNSVGSYLLSVSYKYGGGKVRLYFDHYFEDQSQLFFQYGWKDGLYGCELTLPKNPVIGSFVYEYVRTDDQTGPIYHDGNSQLPDQISAVDNYYNHLIYPGWQHWGQAIGNPLYTSPIYNSDHKLVFHNNRFRAHHFGISGNPTASLHYRMLYTYSANWGIYERPFDDKKYNTSFLTEITFSPRHIGRWNTSGNSVRCAFSFDRGSLLGNNTGFQLSFLSNGLLKL